jgi:hypothetical protein
VEFFGYWFEFWLKINWTFWISWKQSRNVQIGLKKSKFTIHVFGKPKAEILEQKKKNLSLIFFSVWSRIPWIIFHEASIVGAADTKQNSVYGSYQLIIGALVIWTNQSLIWFFEALFCRSILPPTFFAKDKFWDFVLQWKFFALPFFAIFLFEKLS